MLYEEFVNLTGCRASLRIVVGLIGSKNK